MPPRGTADAPPPARTRGASSRYRLSSTAQCGEILSPQDMGELRLLSNSAFTCSASALSIWHVPATTWPPPPYLRQSAPTSTGEVRSRIDLCPVRESIKKFSNTHPVG